MVAWAEGCRCDCGTFRVYATALGARDRFGWAEWPADLADQVFDPTGRPRTSST
jgi:hypothetical protein